MSRTRQDPPWPLRIPDMERRKREAVAVAKWKGQPSAHALLVSYVVDGLDRDIRAMAQTTTVGHSRIAGPVPATSNVDPATEEELRALSKDIAEQTSADLKKHLQRNEVSPNFKKGGKK